MEITRFLGMSRPLPPLMAPSSSFSSATSSSSSSVTTRTLLGRCVGKVGLNIYGDDRNQMSHYSKQRVCVKAALVSAPQNILTTSSTTFEESLKGGVLDLLSLILNVAQATLNLLVRRAVIRRRTNPRKLHLQMLIQRVIIDCRFFTLFAVAGTLLGSALCFIDGCFIVLETYFLYFHTLSRTSDQGNMIQLLIEAIDMFLVGTAFFLFGVGLYAMFVGSRTIKENGAWLSGSNLFGLFYMKRVPSWVEMQSITRAKSKIGHAVMMILQVGVLEKFKSISLITAVDLACFSAAVLTSSASIFILSKLSSEVVIQKKTT